MTETKEVLDESPVATNTTEPHSLKELAQQVAESDPDTYGRRGIFPILRRPLGIGRLVNKAALRHWFRSQVTKNDPQPPNK
jgi:hypothetical protein